MLGRAGFWASLAGVRNSASRARARLIMGTIIPPGAMLTRAAEGAARAAALPARVSMRATAPPLKHAHVSLRRRFRERQFSRLTEHGIRGACAQKERRSGIGAPLGFRISIRRYDCPFA